MTAESMATCCFDVQPCMDGDSYCVRATSSNALQAILAHLDLALLETNSRLDNRLDNVPLDAVEKILPATLQVPVDSLVQHHLEVRDAHRALPGMPMPQMSQSPTGSK